VEGPLSSGYHIFLGRLEICVNLTNIEFSFIGFYWHDCFTNRDKASIQKNKKSDSINEMKLNLKDMI